MKLNAKTIIVFYLIFLVKTSNVKSQCLTCTSNIPLNNGLIWCHPFNGNANDVTGNGYDGIVSNATLIPDRAGNSNSAYQFNGNSSYISIPKLLPAILTTFSLSMWIKPGNNNGNGFIFWEGNNACGNDIYLVVQNSTIKLGANKSANLGGLGNSAHTYTVPGSFINTWTHIVWVMEPTISRLYINGILAQTIISTGNGSGFNYPASYGSKYDGIGGPCGVERQFYYQGAIDDVRLYNRSLNNNEANSLFNIIPGTSPTINSISDRNICKGDSIQVNPIVSNATNYIWSPANGVSNSNIPNPYFKPAITTNYILTAINNLCSAKDTFTINVNSLNLELGPDKNLCLGDSLQVNPIINDANNYLWTPNLNVSNSNISNPYFKPTSTTKYYLNISNGTCSLLDSITINVNNISIEIGPDQTICEGDSIQLNPVAGAGNFSWTPAIGLSSPNAKTTIAKPTESTKYYLNYSNGTCSIIDSILVNVNKISVELGSDLILCSGDSIKINPNTVNATNFSWSPNIGISDSTIKNPFFKPNLPIKYTLQISNGACNAKDSVLIDTKSVNVDLGNDLSICLGDTIRLNATAGNGTYAWFPNFEISDTTIANPKVQPKNNIKYFVNYKEFGCIAKDSIIINVKQIGVEAGPDITICPGDSIQLKANEFGGNIITWTPSIGLSNPNILQPWARPDSTQKYYIKIEDGVCSKTDSINVQIFSNQSITKTNDTSICAGDRVQLQIIGGTNWEWLNPYRLSSSNVSNPEANPLVDTNYYVKISNGVCFTFDTISIKVVQLPIINAGRDTFHCYEKNTQIFGKQFNSQMTYWLSNPYFSDTFNLKQVVSIKNQYKFILVGNNQGCLIYDTIEVIEKPKVVANFTVNPDKGFIPLNIDLSNKSTNFNTFNWTLNGNSINGELPDTSFTYKNKTDLTILLTVSDSNGCFDTLTKTVKIISEPIFKIPNVFTPNEDGFNDYFEILFNPEAFKYVEYEIYNRWGQLMYSTKMPGGKWWDGNYNGTKCPDGVYFYIALGEAIDGKLFNSRGSVTLLR